MSTELTSPMCRTHLVSFPRSGQHLVVRALEWVYPDWIFYSEYYKTSCKFDTCQYVNLQKNHDFDLSLEIDPGFLYIVLYRDFVCSMLSYFDYKLNHNDNSINDTTQDFVGLFKESIEYYIKFRNKWLSGECPNNMIRFSFDEIIASPSSCVRKIASKMIVRERTSVNNGHENAFRTLDIAVAAWPKRNAKSHRYYPLLMEELGKTNYEI